MRTKSSESEANDAERASLGLPVPIRDSDLFKHTASAPILNFLVDNPEFELSVRQLSRLTPVSDRATADAVDVLAANGLIDVRHEGNARQVRIDRSRLQDPEDPIERIPQVPYRTPVRVIAQYVRDELADVLGIVLFGSVARGEADRRSDIDLWVLVGDDLLEQRNAANRLARHLEGLQIPPAIALAEARDEDFEAHWEEIRARLEADDAEWASAERHSVEFVVETPESIRQQSTRVDAGQLFGSGITLHDSEALTAVKREVLRHE
ncbi:DNA polymerase beta domain protein region [Halorhabdus utahensis DSM 12940]|uniref:DNA polymerase beta domain protein region n=1 Tax=Halorhabdus utahensis (strain DSM 12940 / JCM 11049 / AX-2) TaxID=519442 RepID=C7NPX5_HALUD|nr:nucleotidyltransferase domain-containing protein [Halorhabdus utahensis]ACV10422.1 DNA polymerase beta domain protein region [Halorhabdus utahensis DSM 12940]